MPPKMEYLEYVKILLVTYSVELEQCKTIVIDGRTRHMAAVFNT